MPKSLITVLSIARRNCWLDGVDVETVAYAVETGVIQNVSYAVFGCSNFAGSAEFLSEFGLVPSHSVAGRTYYRGAKDRPYLFILEEAETAGLRAVGYETDSEDSLRAMADRLGVPVEPIDDTPWGGLRAIVPDVDGNPVHLVHGIGRVAPLETREEFIFNSGGQIRRKGRLPIMADGKTPVLHLCHVVHTSPDVRRFVDWYVQNLGAYPSDFFSAADDADKMAACFMRFPRGLQYVDHHNVAVFEGEPRGVQHVCFESLDLDAIFMAHRHLKKRGYHHSWGPIRHAVGGAISDYWFTPWGLRVEHVIDGDVVNEEFETRTVPLCDENGFQWTVTDIPADFSEVGSS